MSKILLSGGTGYIGSHTAVELLQAGHDVVIIDNLSNSDISVVDRIETITGERPDFICADCADKNAMNAVFCGNNFDAVMNFAGYKSVGESIGRPVEYYRNNLDIVLTLLEIMEQYGCRRFIFSSSATVYSASDNIPYSENEKNLGCTNPYGWSKYMIERFLTDAASADREMSVVLLRYFNPIGAHESGLIGENPNGTPNNLMPCITQTAAGLRKELLVFGGDYPTPDGTGVRDYIHVSDLARGHAAALSYAMNNTGVQTVNLGTGTGYSVLEVINTFCEATGVRVPYTITARRPGDVAVCYADVSKAEQLFGWKAHKTLRDMCIDSWRWQLKSSEYE